MVDFFGGGEKTVYQMHAREEDLVNNWKECGRSYDVRSRCTSMHRKEVCTEGGR